MPKSWPTGNYMNKIQNKNNRTKLSTTPCMSLNMTHYRPQHVVIQDIYDGSNTISNDKSYR
jgi:hypothetical protein